MPLKDIQRDAAAAERPIGATRYWKSLRGRMSILFLSLFMTITLLGMVGVWSLHTFNEASISVRDRWLPNTRLLGDLNDFTSDYRTAEADSQLARSAEELASTCTISRRWTGR